MPPVESRADSIHERLRSPEAVASRSPQVIRPLRSALLLTLYYAALGLLWIGFSDRALFAIVQNQQQLETLSSAKGDIFIAVTSVGLFLMTYGYLALLKAAEARFEFEERSREIGVRQGYVDVLSAVTGGKLIIVTDVELEHLLGENILESRPIQEPAELSPARALIAEVLRSRAVRDPDAALIAVGEALTNGIKHARGCRYELRTLRDTLQIVVSDNGPGIDFKTLPKATLVPGFSTSNTMGLGFTIMLDVCDRLLLCTNEHGTTVVLEMGLERADTASRARLSELVSG